MPIPYPINVSDDNNRPTKSFRNMVDAINQDIADIQVGGGGGGDTIINNYYPSGPLITLSTTAPSSPQPGDIWIQIT